MIKKYSYILFIPLISTLSLSFLLIPQVYAQSDISAVHQKTDTPNTARYDIVQSEITAMWTFRLDRYYGNVAQIVSTSTGGTAWEDMVVIDLPLILDATAKPRFLIFTSAIASRYTYMIDSVTGKTWQLVTSEGGNKIWSPL